MQGFFVTHLVLLGQFFYTRTDQLNGMQLFETLLGIFLVVPDGLKGQNRRLSW